MTIRAVNPSSVTTSVSAAVNSTQCYLTTTVELYIVNLHLNSTPIFTLDSYTFRLSNETLSVGVVVGWISASPGTSSLSVEYYLVGNGGNYTVDRSSGAVSVAQSLGAQPYPSCVLTAVARAVTVGPIRAGTQSTASIWIIGSNSSTSSMSVYFEQQAFEASVVEDAAVGTSVLRVQATLEDGSGNHVTGIIRYEIAGGNVGHVFEMTSSTGWIYTAAKLNYSVTPAYNITVLASVDSASIYGIV